jgi:hypothetical protein
MAHVWQSLLWTSGLRQGLLGRPKYQGAGEVSYLGETGERTTRLRR